MYCDIKSLGISSIGATNNRYKIDLELGFIFHKDVWIKEIEKGELFIENIEEYNYVGELNFEKKIKSSSDSLIIDSIDAWIIVGKTIIDEIEKKKSSTFKIKCNIYANIYQEGPGPIPMGKIEVYPRLDMKICVIKRSILRKLLLIILEYSERFLNLIKRHHNAIIDILELL